MTHLRKFLLNKCTVSAVTVSSVTLSTVTDVCDDPMLIGTAPFLFGASSNIIPYPWPTRLHISSSYDETHNYLIFSTYPPDYKKGAEVQHMYMYS